MKSAPSAGSTATPAVPPGQGSFWPFSVNLLTMGSEMLTHLPLSAAWVAPQSMSVIASEARVKAVGMGGPFRKRDLCGRRIRQYGGKVYLLRCYNTGG